MSLTLRVLGLAVLLALASGAQTTAPVRDLSGRIATTAQPRFVAGGALDGGANAGVALDGGTSFRAPDPPPVGGAIVIYGEAPADAGDPTNGMNVTAGPQVGEGPQVGSGPQIGDGPQVGVTGSDAGTR